jgi:regulatory protein
MIITSITQQKGKDNRYNIYIDNSYSFSADYEDLLDFNIKENIYLDDSSLSELIYRCQFKKALNKSYRFLSNRPRSEFEIRKKLKEYCFDEHVVDEVIQKLKGYNYINDAEFSKLWIEEREKIKPSGKRKLADELKAKGIKTEIISSVLEGHTDDMNTAEAVAAKKISTIQGSIEDPRNYQRVYRYLIYRGFDYDTARKAIAKCTGSYVD